MGNMLGRFSHHLLSAHTSLLLGLHAKVQTFSSCLAKTVFLPLLMERLGTCVFLQSVFHQGYVYSLEYPFSRQ